MNTATSKHALPLDAWSVEVDNSCSLMFGTEIPGDPSGLLRNQGNGFPRRCHVRIAAQFSCLRNLFGIAAGVVDPRGLPGLAALERRLLRKDLR